MVFHFPYNKTLPFVYKTLTDGGLVCLSILVLQLGLQCHWVYSRKPGLCTSPQIHQPSPVAGSSLNNFHKVTSAHSFRSHHLLSSLHCIFKIYTYLVYFPVYVSSKRPWVLLGQVSALLFTSVFPELSTVKRAGWALNKYLLNEQNEWRNVWDHQLPVENSHL